MSIFYVILSTCCVVLPICHVILSTCSVVLPTSHVVFVVLSTLFCRLVYLLSSCRVVLSSCLLVLWSCLPVALSCLFRGYPKIWTEPLTGLCILEKKRTPESPSSHHLLKCCRKRNRNNAFMVRHARMRAGHRQI